LAMPSATLDARLTAESGWVGTDGMQLYLDGSLGAPELGLHGEFNRNLAIPDSDVVLSVGGTGRLCPTAAPEGGSELSTTLSSPESYTPAGPIWLVPSAPLDPTTLTITASAAGQPVPVQVSEYYYGIVKLSPQVAFPPNAELSLDVSAVRDVFGNPVHLQPAPTAMKTTAVVTDLSFDTAPPSGAAVCGDQCGVDGTGRLALRARCGDGRAVIGLSAPSVATKVVVTYRFAGDFNPGNLKLIDVAGKVTVLPLVLNAEQNQQVEGSPPSTGSLWLVWDLRQLSCEPQWISPNRGLLEIDEIRFE
jgi:hypothetical protein